MDEYIYGVARIRALESTLLTDEDVKSLAEAKDYNSALQMLKDKGWGSNTPNESLNDIIEIEKNKTREVIDDIIKDKDDKEVLIVEDEYHNLKTAIKLRIKSQYCRVLKFCDPSYQCITEVSHKSFCLPLSLILNRRKASNRHMVCSWTWTACCSCRK